jgi:tellurite resistance protein
MTHRTPNFARVLAPSSARGEDNGPLRGDEIDAVLEIAYAMANANGDASVDELESFRALVKHLKPAASVADLLDAFGDALDKAESIEERVRAAAAHLKRPAAREAAYKVAYTVAVFDLETNEEERELDELLIEILGLSSRVDDLENEVNLALST